MKISQSWFLAGCLSLASALSSHAQSTTIRIVAAQAFRQPVDAAITHILKPGYQVGFSGASESTALQAIYSGTTINGNFPVIIKTTYGISVTAIRSLTQNLTSSATVNPYLVDGSFGANQGTFESGTTSDVALSGEYQTTTLFPTPVLHDYIVGVGPYLWVRSAGAPGPLPTQLLAVTTVATSTSATLTSTANLSPGELVSGNPNIPDGTHIATVPDGTHITLSNAATGSGSAVSTTFAYTGLGNISDGLTRNLLDSGQIALSQFTGSSADQNTLVTILGRDEGASSREVLFAECGFGTFGTPDQYLMDIDTMNNVVTGSEEYPGGGINTSDPVTKTDPPGFSGYPTFKLVATALNTPNPHPETNGWFVGYLDPADAALVNGGKNIMSWNGVPYSPEAVENGQYTYWSYFHWLYRPDFAAGNSTAKIVADQISKQIHDSDAAAGGAGILIPNMKVNRQIDGGDVKLGPLIQN